MITKEILISHPVSVLKKEISKTNIKGYSKMRKLELIDLMMKPEHAGKFSHIKKGAAYIPGDLKPIKKDKKIVIKRTPKPAPAPKANKKIVIKRTPKPAPAPAPKIVVKTSKKPLIKSDAVNDKNNFTPFQVSTMSTQSLKASLTLFIDFSKYFSKDEILFYKELKDRGAKIPKAVEKKYKLTISKNDKGEAKTPKPTPAPAKKEKELSEFTKEEVEEKYKDLGEFQKVNNKILDRAEFILTKDKNKINKMIEVYKKINVQGKKGVSSNFNQVRNAIRDKLERDQQNCETLINSLRSKIKFIKKNGSKKDLPFGEKTIKSFLNEGHELIKKNSSCLNKKQLEEIKNLGIVTKNYYNNLTDTIKEEKEVKDEFLKLYPAKK